MTNNNHNYCIILAGGIGSRLWPISQEKMPKQFLDPFGAGRTLLQATFDRIAKVLPVENIYLSTTIDYLALAQEQLPELPRPNILAEPVRRGTFSSVAWALTIITERDNKANILVTPADQLILREENFATDIQDAFSHVAECDCILTMGIRPTRPDTSYGYIQTDCTVASGTVSPIKSFTEKPDSQFANMFVQSGEFLWNTGLYLFHRTTFYKLVNIIIPDHVKALRTAVEQEQCPLSQIVEQHYGYFPNMSLDKAVTEYYNKVHVRACSFGWADMGNWSSLYSDLPADQQGNVRLHTEATFYSGTGNVISLPRGEKAFVAGLSGYIIAQKDGILMICPKGDTAMRRRMMNDSQMSQMTNF